MKVTVCIGSSCHIKGSRQVVEKLKDLIAENNLGDKVELGGTFCLGNCQAGVCVKVDGEFFSVSHYSNGVELNGMKEMPGFVEKEVEESKAYLLDNTPMVTRVTVDEENDTITIEGTNFNEITWVSNGNVILRESDVTDGKVTLNLHSADLLDEPYLYVRFYITGENGICYSQPFVLNVEGEEFDSVEVTETVIDLPWFLRKLVTVVDWVAFRFNPLIWIFKYYALGYNVFERFFNPF